MTSSASSSFEMINNPLALFGLLPVNPRALIHLNLANKKLNLKLATRVAKCLKDSATLPRLGTLSITGDRLHKSSGKVIAAGLLVNTTLHTLFITQGQAGMSDGVVAIFDALSNTSRIAALQLQRARFDTASFQALHTVLNTNPSLKTLTLDWCSSFFDQQNHLRHLMSAPHLQSLAIARSHFDENAGHGEDRIFCELDTNTTLKTLVLNYCGLADCHAIALARVFSKGNTSLTELGMSNHKIGPVGVQYLVDALATNTVLTALNLGQQCGVGDSAGHSQDSWIHLERLLTLNTTLQGVDVSNHPLQDREFHLISLKPTFTMSPPLTVLNLSFTHFDHNSMQRLLKVLPEGLTKLDLTGCFPIREGACDPGTFMENITELLNHHTALTNLSFGGPALKDMPLAAALKDNTLLRFLKIKNVSTPALGIEELCKALAENSTLNTFTLTRVGRSYEIAEVLARITEIYETYLPFNGSLTRIQFDNSDKSAPIAQMLRRNGHNMRLKTNSLFQSLFRFVYIQDWMRPDVTTEFNRGNAKRTRRV